MGCTAATALVATLLRAASLDVDLGLRAESRASALEHSELGGVSRASLSAVPRADVVAQAGGLLLETRYAPRLWTSDVKAQASPLVSHTVEARLATVEERTWRAQAMASGFVGKTDPLADPWRVAAGSDARWQLATTEPLRYEELRTAARAEVALDLRTTVAGGAAFQVSRPSDPDVRHLLPPQRGGSVEASLTRLATERDTLRLEASGRRTLTGVPAGEIRITSSSAAGSWRRRASPYTQVWLAAGATFVFPDRSRPDASLEVVPVGEVGLARGGEGLDASLELAARATTYVDRFTGEVNPFAEGVCTVRWRVTPQVSLSLSASGGASTDGETVLTGGDARVLWTLREHLALELGASGRLQDERRPGLPSVREGALVLALVYTIQPLSLGPAR